MFERIVAAIDSDPERSARVVEAAQELAQKFSSRVVVAHVREVERPAAIVGTARPGALPPALHFESEEEARALVDTAVARLRAVGVRAEALDGWVRDLRARVVVDASGRRCFLASRLGMKHKDPNFNQFCIYYCICYLRYSIRKPPATAVLRKSPPTARGPRLRGGQTFTSISLRTAVARWPRARTSCSVGRPNFAGRISHR